MGCGSQTFFSLVQGLGTATTLRRDHTAFDSNVCITRGPTAPIWRLISPPTGQGPSAEEIEEEKREALNVETRVLDARDLDLEPESFDAAISRLVLMLIPERAGDGINGDSDQCVVSPGGAVSSSATFFRSSPNERMTSASPLLRTTI